MSPMADALTLIDDRRAPTAKDDRCGCGCLIVTRESRRFTLPLRAVSFSAQVAERVAEVTVEQTFENTYAELLEAVYIFPLPGGAAVSRFELHVDGKQLVGIVEERGEARRQYDAAIQQGKKAALLEQERDDVFTVKVGNLPPRSIATIKMVYSERLPAFDDGETELRIPLVVAPRYIPGQPLERASLGDGTEVDTTSVPDASRISPPRLAPGLRGDVALGITIDLLGSDAVDELGCTQHATKVAGSGGRLTVALARKDELLDRDFVLRWRTAAAQERPVLLVAKKGGECYGLLSLVPPREVREGQGARDVVFLLDRSGSMAGPKMDSAKRAVLRLVETLQPHDRFALCAFSDSPSWCTDGFIAAGRDGFRRAHSVLNGIAAAGGTELDSALGECFSMLENTSGVLAPGGMQKLKPAANRLPILVLVTDGEVGNESEILRRVEGRLANVRVFTLGIDTAVNAAFLRRLAQLGRGTATLCPPGAGLEDALARIGKEIGTPVLLDIEVEDRGLGFDGASITPERLPDLFAGRTASVFFKCRATKGQIKIRAKRAEGGVYEQVVSAESVDLAALSQLWAKSRISDLEDRYRLAYGGAGGGLEASRAEILGLALEHQLLTRFTAFIVIDHSEVAERLARRTVVQAVETPDQWDGEQKHESAIAVSKSKVAFRKDAGPPPAARGPAPRLTGRAPVPPASPAAPGSSFRKMGPPPPPASIRANERVVFGDDEDGPAFKMAELIAPDPLGAPPPSAAAGGGGGGQDPFALDLELDSTPKGGGMNMPRGGRARRDAVASSDEAFADALDMPEGGEEMEAPAEWIALSGSAKGKPAGRAPAPRAFATVVDELGKELASIVAALDRGEWPKDAGARLGVLREECLAALAASRIAHVAVRTKELVGAKLAMLIEALRARKGKPQDLANGARAASEALAAQCRSELAPLLGSGGSPWEASI